MDNSLMLRVAKDATAMITPDAVRDIAAFLSGKRDARGGYCGRDNHPDLYYTSFALACMHALNLARELEQSRGYVDTFLDNADLDLVHLCCLIRGYTLTRPRENLLPQPALAQMELFRSLDLGYSHTAAAAAGCTAYGCFLARQAYLECNTAMPDEAAMLDALAAGVRQATGASTLGAAISVLSDCNRSIPSNAVDRLMALYHADGGFVAFAGCPEPDLLSTAAALFALRSHAGIAKRIRPGCLDFINRMWHESGGFCGLAADPEPDCEYTFYALLGLGCLA